MLAMMLLLLLYILAAELDIPVELPLIFLSVSFADSGLSSYSTDERSLFLFGEILLVVISCYFEVLVISENICIGYYKSDSFLCLGAFLLLLHARII